MPFPLLIPTFFFSAWLLMIFWGMVSPDVGVATVGYPKAMLATIGLWLVIFPVARRSGPKGGGGRSFTFKGPFGAEMRRGSGDADSGETDGRSQTLTDDEIDISSSFNGIARKITSQNFRGGNINTNFGGVQLDLREANLADGAAALNLKMFVGGVDIRVPEGWNVESDISATVGGVSDERKNSGSSDQDAPKLTIKGSATFGGLSLRN